MITPDPDFPRLTPANHRDTSPATPLYNCIAWAAGDTAHWWQPGRHWPDPDWPATDTGIEALESMFRGLGYVGCGPDSSLEEGFEKVATYRLGNTYTHAARQLPDGKWTSKLGKDVDIEHDSPDDLNGPIYGEVAQIMKRPTRPIK